MSIETNTQSKLLHPEELHPHDITHDVLGRQAVLAYDFHYAGHETLARLENKAAKRTDQPASEHEDGVMAIFNTPRSHFTPEELALSREWENAMIASGIDPVRGKGKEIPITGLEKVRAEVAKISVEDNGKRFDTYFDTIAPDVIKGWVDAWVEDHTVGAEGFSEGGKWLRWLARSSENDLDDQQLLNFLQWHNNRIEDLQYAREVEEANYDIDKLYLEQIKKADGDWLAVGSYERAVADLSDPSTDHLVSDEFAGAKRLSVAYAKDFKTHYIPEGQTLKNINELVDLMWESGFHERNHIALGSFNATWLDEAMAEHLALVLEGERELEDVAAEEGEVYSLERNILHELLLLAKDVSSGRVDISIRDFTRAYTSPEESREREILNEKLYDIFGFHALAALNSVGEALMDEAIAEGKGITERELETTTLARLLGHLQDRKEHFADGVSREFKEFELVA